MDGIVAGVGAVIGFIPQMVILFLLLGFLELCGYMSRVAFIMDRIFRKFGLSGKSFIPMLIASGCGVPAVMATKTIENEKDRRMTIMTTTMIPCGAKMPIIALVFGAIASGNSDATWYVAPMFYFMGVVAIILSGIMLKKTKLFAGETTPFIMELPQYHMPGVKNILLSMWERVKGYIIKAGTIIFLSTIVIWFLMNFGDAGEGFGLLDSEAPDYMEYSLMAGLGNLLAWIFAPLGFANWQATATRRHRPRCEGERRRDCRHHHSARRFRRGGPAALVRLCPDARRIDRCDRRLLRLQPAVRAVLRGDGYHPPAAAFG